VPDAIAARLGPGLPGRRSGRQPFVDYTRFAGTHRRSHGALYSRMSWVIVLTAELINYHSRRGGSRRGTERFAVRRDTYPVSREFAIGSRLFSVTVASDGRRDLPGGIAHTGRIRHR